MAEGFCNSCLRVMIARPGGRCGCGKTLRLLPDDWDKRAEYRGKGKVKPENTAKEEVDRKGNR